MKTTIQLFTSFLLILIMGTFVQAQPKMKVDIYVTYIGMDDLDSACPNGCNSENGHWKLDAGLDDQAQASFDLKRNVGSSGGEHLINSYLGTWYTNSYSGEIKYLFQCREENVMGNFIEVKDDKFPISISDFYNFPIIDYTTNTYTKQFQIRYETNEGKGLWIKISVRCQLLSPPAMSITIKNLAGDPNPNIQPLNPPNLCSSTDLNNSDVLELSVNKEAFADISSTSTYYYSYQLESDPYLTYSNWECEPGGGPLQRASPEGMESGIEENTSFNAVENGNSALGCDPRDKPLNQICECVSTTVEQWVGVNPADFSLEGLLSGNPERLTDRITFKAELYYNGRIIARTFSSKKTIYNKKVNLDAPTVLAPENTSCVGGLDGKLVVTKLKIGDYIYRYRSSADGAQFVSTGVLIEGKSTFTISGLAAGTYILQVADYIPGGVEMCFDNKTFTIGSPPPLVITETNITCSDCKPGRTLTEGIPTFESKCVGSPVNVTIPISGGAGGYRYNLTGPTGIYEPFTGGALTLNLSPNTTHTIYFKDAKGCPKTQQVRINNPTPLSLVATSVVNQVYDAYDITHHISCYGGKDGSITLAASGGSQGYTAVVKKGVQVVNCTISAFIEDVVVAGKFNCTISGLLEGIYTVTVSDSYGCSIVSSNITLTQPTAITVDQSSASLCFDMEDKGSITILAKGGVVPEGVGYTYTLKDSKGVKVGDPVVTEDKDEEAVFEELDPGSYTVEINDLGDCIKISNPIVIPFPINIELFQAKTPSCFGGDDGSLEVTVTGGTGSYTYEWAETPQTTKKITGLSKGIYTLTVKDANNCEKSAEFELDDPELLGVQLGSSTMAVETICVGTTRKLVPTLINPSADQTYTYTWTSDKGLNIVAVSLDVKEAGWYNVQVLSDKGCIAEDRITIETEYLTLSLPEKLNRCKGEQLILDAGYSDADYEWSWKEGVLLGTNKTLTVTESGTYSLKVVQADGCTGYDAVEVNFEYLSLHIAEDENILCRGESISFDAGNPGSSYSWHSSNGFTSDKQVVSISNEGTYFLKVSMPSGCIAFDTLEVKFGLAMNIHVADDVNTICNGGKLVINAGYPGSTYYWTSDNGFTSNQQIVTLQKAGTYYLTLIRPSGCINYDTLKVEFSPPMSIHVADDVTTLCKGQNLELDAGLALGFTGATYWWHSPNGFDSNRQKVTLKDPGTYYLRVVLSTGCIAFDTLEVKYSDNILKANFILVDYAFAGDTLIAIDITLPVPANVTWEVWKEDTGQRVDIKVLNSYMAEMRFKEAGKYIVRQTVRNYGCNDVMEKKIVIYPAPIKDGGGAAAGTGNDQPLIQEFTIYPNPSSGRFRVKVKLTEPSNVRVSLYNAQMGSPVLVKEGSQAKDYDLEFNKTDGGTGLYFLIVQAGGEQKHLRLIVY